MLATNWIDRIGATHLGERAIAAPAAEREAPRAARPFSVPEIELAGIRLWSGDQVSRRESYGKGNGQIHSLGGTTPEPSCHEVELAEALRSIREKSYWFSPGGFGGLPTRWHPWARSTPGKKVAGLADAPDWLADLDRSIRAIIAAPRGGTPDVIAWDDVNPIATAIFVECKGATEAFKASQGEWMWAARRLGVRQTSSGYRFVLIRANPRAQ